MKCIEIRVCMDIHVYVIHSVSMYIHTVVCVTFSYLFIYVCLYFVYVYKVFVCLNTYVCIYVCVRHLGACVYLYVKFVLVVGSGSKSVFVFRFAIN